MKLAAYRTGSREGSHEERLVELVVEDYRYARRWGLGPGTWAHELLWLPEGFFAAWGHRLESGERINHFAYPDDRADLVQGAWRRAAGRVVPLAALSAARSSRAR